MPRLVYECLAFDTATATCTQAAFVEREAFPVLSVADALELLTAVAVCFVVAWGWKYLSRHVRSG